MKKLDLTLGISGIILGALFFLIPYITDSLFSQITFGIGGIAIVIILLLIFIIYDKFKEIDDFIKKQDHFNNELKERFKIHDRLNKLEIQMEYINKK